MTVAQRRAVFNRVRGKKKGKQMMAIDTDRKIKSSKGGQKVKGGSKKP